MSCMSYVGYLSMKSELDSSDIAMNPILSAESQS